ncbi:MAG: hypothetical protein GX129_13210 [Clostridiales bacterium]|jgi:hypothetical protein|nr:hypothetical protein [Clostridiales bacterium]
MYITITGYVRLGYCEEYSYTYDPLFKFVAQAVINPESKFGCTLEEIRYGNKDYIESIEASSELTDAYGTYYGKNIIDDDYKTAWVPDNKGDAVGEYILVNLDKERPLYGFAIANGYFKSLSTFENNGKARSIKLEFDNEEIKYDLTIPDRFEGIDGLTDTTAYSDIFYFGEPMHFRYSIIVLSL